MGKRLTIEFVRESFEAEGYKLLTEKWENSKQKLDYICPKGHKHSIKWNGWQQGKRCFYCYGNVKLTIEFVRESFEDRGYKLLTKEYINNSQKLDYVCPKQRKGQITWNNWNDGKRCPCCSGTLKKTIEFIRESFEAKGYTLLTMEYKNVEQKLEYVCPIGHKHSVSWVGWYCNDNKCPYCVGNAKLTIGFIREEFKKEGYILLTGEYVNSRQKLDYICPEGHKHSICWSNWNHPKKHRCPTCYRLNNVGHNHPSWKGGISKEPYCQDWGSDLKELVKERDGSKCSNPYCSSNDPQDLTVHHIDYNKKSCGPENLITVCRSCNSTANKDRNWHQNWYQAIIYRREYNNESTI